MRPATPTKPDSRSNPPAGRGTADTVCWVNIIGPVTYATVLPKSPMPFKKFKRVTPSKGKTAVTFIVPRGNYAVAAFHDEDGDGGLSTNFFGIPNEGFGFGNDARGSMGPPSFKDCVVNVSNGGTIKIKLDY